MNEHRSLQRRVMIAVGVVVVLGLIIAVPLAVNDDLRYDLAISTGLAPGKDAKQLTDSESEALLIVLPLNNGDVDGTSPWLYRAQFIAWPNAEGNELENLESGERAQMPLETIDFTASNGDGSLVLLRGSRADTGATTAFTIHTDTMQIQELPEPNAVPDEEGDWITPTWEKTYGICNRPSPDRRFAGCFTRSGTSSYLAGDWQFDLQTWGDYETVTPLYRGQGFLPWVGFAQNDTVVYFQNELGIVRIDVPDDALDAAPIGTPYEQTVATPVD